MGVSWQYFLVFHKSPHWVSSILRFITTVLKNNIKSNTRLWYIYIYIYIARVLVNLENIKNPPQKQIGFLLVCLWNSAIEGLK
jgi:hypothetical protein